MSTTLTYFDFDASRGLECRLALHVAGVPFVDERLGREQWMARKPTTPFGGLPVLTVDGRVLAQSTPILTWVGRTHGLHPTDPFVAAEHEALMGSVEDLRNKLPNVRDLPDAEKKSVREAFGDGWLRQWANAVSARIVGPFVEGDRLHVVDLKLYTVLRAFLAGTWDHLPPSLLDATPKLGALHAAVDADPRVKTWFAGRPTPGR